MSPPRALVIQHCSDDGPARLGDWLIDAGLALDVVHPYAGGVLPEELSGYAALIVLGGPQAAYDPTETAAPWMDHTLALLRAAVAGRVPTLGVCLGGQLLARAMGGVILPGRNGPEVGAHLVAKRDIAADDAFFRTVPFIPDVIQWHFDEIAELPVDAVLLASSPAYPNQAFRVGECAWGLQFHIETTPDMVRQWAAEGRAEVEAWDIDVDAALSSAIAAHDDVAEAWQPAAARFAELSAAYAQRCGAPH